MGLDSYDLKTLTSEAQILGAKLDRLNSHLRDLKLSINSLNNNQVRANVLLETLIDREKDRYK